jgi:protease-4
MWRLFILTIAVVIGGGCQNPLQVSTRVRVTSPPDHTAEPVAATPLPGQVDGCQGTIALIDVNGLLLNRNMTGLGSMGENSVALFREKLDAAEQDPSVRAVVLRINSPGGGVTASDIMRHDLEQFKRRKNVPVVTCLMDLGTGGAYYLATASDTIVAHPTTVTGGIGVILNLYNLQDTMAQFNVLGVAIKAGENIDLGSPTQAMTPESRALLQHVADEFWARFRDAVVASRPAGRSLPGEIFDGRIFTARAALELGLVDSIGYLEDAVAIARGMAQVDERTTLAFYRRPNDRTLSPYDITPNVPLQNSFMPLSIPGLDRSQLPTFLYLWQPEPGLEKTGGN